MPARRRAKIVATLGPASSSPEQVRELVEAGLDVARINFSHGEPRSWKRSVDSVRRAQRETGKPIAIMGDLQGPKIRIGTVPGGTEITRGQQVHVWTASDTDGWVGDDGGLNVSCAYPALIDEVEPGGRIYLRDGELDLRVDAIDGARIAATVRGGGLLTSRAGLHAPGAGLLFASVTDADRANARFAVEHGLDVLALSFVRNRTDLVVAREAIADAGGDLPIISKIETLSAINDLDSIIDASDGAMVARGDLGVEVGPAEVPVAQRAIIAAAGRALMPVIIATQMLESMTTRQRPTRAEASDVANAVWDGADALMLSGETAVGKHPVEVVAMMDSIIRTAEQADPQRAARSVELSSDTARTISQAVATAVEQHPQVKAVIIFTVSGHSGRLLSQVRLSVPTIVLAPSAAVLQRLALSWGVDPRYCDPPDSIEEMLGDVERAAVQELGLSAGDSVVVTGGLPLGCGEPTNFLKLHKVPSIS